MSERKRIAIITSSHSPYDERIFWKFGKTLCKCFDICIISSQEDADTYNETIRIIGFAGIQKPVTKIKRFYSHLSDFKPDIIFCAQPLTILAARRFKKKNKTAKIVYDVTEWYPENIASKLRGLKKVYKYFIMFLMNIYTSNLCDWIVLGEFKKLRRYILIAPFRNKTIIGYYPVLQYFNYSPPSINDNTITLCYAGVITFERGIIKLFEAAKELANKKSNLEVSLLIVGKFSYINEEKEFKSLIANENKVKVLFRNWTDYNRISETIKDADICFDLRKLTFIYKNSLPIKIFEYMACGKPFIYSDISQIRRELGDIKCGFLVDPNNIDTIVNKIINYLDDSSLLRSHSLEGRKIIENGKNWETESSKLLNLVDNLLK